jgi:protein TonB
MSTEKSIKVESMDEIVFANRNKEYGAYELRTRYSKYKNRGLFIAFIIIIFVAGTPFLMALKNNGNKKIVDETISANLLNLKNQADEPPPPPPPPPPPAAELEKVKFTAPVVVDTVVEKVEIATTEEQVNTSVNKEVTEEVVETNKIIKEPDEEVVNFYIIEEKPEFPGGEEGMMKWIAEHIKYPEIAKENGITGKVFIQFVIDKDGRVTNVSVLRGVDPSLDKEALRVISAMPAWTPGKQRGKAVKVSFQLPINFKLN